MKDLVDFIIDPVFMTDVTVRREWSRFENKPLDELTDDDILCILEGKHLIVSNSIADHPVFDSLRRTLSEQGYIHMESGWWNGDRVIRPFRLNGALFECDEKFPCGSAIRRTVEYKLKEQSGDMA